MASLSNRQIIQKWNESPQRWATCFLVISPECIFLYLHFARRRTHARRQVHFRTLGELLSRRENPFSDRSRLPPPRSNTLIIREWARESRQENAGWGATTGKRCGATSGLNQSRGSSVWMEPSGRAAGRPGNMIKEPVAWLRRSSCEWSNGRRQSLALNSPDRDETQECGGEESRALPCDREKIKDWR